MICLLVAQHLARGMCVLLQICAYTDVDRRCTCIPISCKREIQVGVYCCGPVWYKIFFFHLGSTFTLLPQISSIVSECTHILHIMCSTPDFYRHFSDHGQRTLKCADLVNVGR